ncbi:hypothetical protein IAU59_004065 [Kwoniella sp. CBS 9459]
MQYLFGQSPSLGTFASQQTPSYHFPQQSTNPSFSSAYKTNTGPNSYFNNTFSQQSPFGTQPQPQPHSQPHFQSQSQSSLRDPPGHYVTRDGQLYFVQDPLDTDDDYGVSPGWHPGYRTSPYLPQNSAPQQPGLYGQQQQPSYAQQPSYTQQSPYTQYSQQTGATSYLDPEEQRRAAIRRYLQSQGIIPSLPQQQQQQGGMYGNYSQYADPYQNSFPYYQQPEPEPQKTFSIEEYTKLDRLKRYYSGQPLDYEWWQKPPYWKTLDPESGAEIRLIPPRLEVPIDTAPTAGTTVTDPDAATIPTTAPEAAAAAATTTATVNGTTDQAGTKPRSSATDGDESKPKSIWSHAAPKFAQQWSRHRCWSPCETLGDMVEQYLSHKMIDESRSAREHHWDQYLKHEAEKEEASRKHADIFLEMSQIFTGQKTVTARNPREFFADMQKRLEEISKTVDSHNESVEQSKNDLIKTMGAQTNAWIASKLMTELKEDVLTDKKLLDAWETLGKASRTTEDAADGSAYTEASHLDVHISNLLAKRRRKREQEEEERPESEPTYRSTRGRSQTPHPSSRGSRPTATTAGTAAYADPDDEEIIFS